MNVAFLDVFIDLAILTKKSPWMKCKTDGINVLYELSPPVPPAAIYQTP
jgi:hypothetical protein